MTEMLVYLPGQPLERPADALLGGKATRLVELKARAFRVPRFYVISNQAFELALQAAGLSESMENQLKSLSAVSQNDRQTICADLQRQISSVPIPAQMTEEVTATHFEVFGAEVESGTHQLIVRSSVIGEDEEGNSFAGIHDSVAGVVGWDAIYGALRKVWASAFSERAMCYRLQKQLPLFPIQVGVVVQQMTVAETSGVLYTRHPSPRESDRLLVQAIAGQGADLMSGIVEGDTFSIERGSPGCVEQVNEPGDNSQASNPHGHGTSHGDLANYRGTTGTLNALQLQKAAQVGLEIECLFDKPQEIEFCFDREGELFILQSRAAAMDRHDPAFKGNHLVWDNSNIAETYSGRVSPMTFSFLRRIYAIVYHCFAEVMGVRAEVIHRNRRTYDNMLGLIQGQVYYNLKSWHRALRLLPGFNYNRVFMESMVGVKESLELAPEQPAISWSRRWFVEFPALLRTILRSCWNFWSLNRSVDKFHKNFEAHYEKWSTIDFQSMAPHELQSLYYQMEDALLWNWKAPIINDFHVMLSYGVLKKLCQSWCDDTSGSLQNDLLQGEGGIESARPARELLRLAVLATNNPQLRDTILTEDLQALPQLVSKEPTFSKFSEQFEAYIEAYGFRCADELKLEKPSFKEQPHQVYQVLRQYLQLNHPEALDPTRISGREDKIRQEAEQVVREKLRAAGGLFPRRTVFGWVLRNARKGVKNRENMRFARTKIFGLLREMLRAAGSRLAEADLLSQPEDVFYLTLDELWDYVKGTATTTDLKGLVRLRRSEYSEFDQQRPEPADRFETYGMVYDGNSFQPTSHRQAVDHPSVLIGTGCCSGIASGPVRVVDDPSTVSELDGHILVARRMDPGWVPLFPVVSGILVEFGSLLSHAAVVAREMGIPTIIGVSGLSKHINTGMIVRMDGRSGTVEILPPADAESSPGHSEAECQLDFQAEILD